MSQKLTLLALILFVCSCKHPPVGEEFVPVVGLNKKGLSEVNYIPTQTFQRQMSPYIVDMSHQVSNTLEKHEDLESMPWKLTRVTVGLALETEVDLFEIAEAELEGEIELRFQKEI